MPMKDCEFASEAANSFYRFVQAQNRNQDGRIKAEKALSCLSVCEQTASQFLSLHPLSIFQSDIEVSIPIDGAGETVAPLGRRASRASMTTAHLSLAISNFQR
jgi:hypothetical protein